MRSARNYNAARAGVDTDLRLRLGPINPVLVRIDPLLATPIHLAEPEFRICCILSATAFWTTEQEARFLWADPDGRAERPADPKLPGLPP